MDWQLIAFGIGVSAVSYFLRYALPSLPRWFSWAGVTMGVLMVASRFLPNIPLGPTALFILSAGGLVGSIVWFLQSPPTPLPISAPLLPPAAQGGAGGNATVQGNGMAIGGRGGPAGDVAGGLGGRGGDAILTGDGLAAGGDGGAAGSETVWSHPAKSGYEAAMKQLGRPIDPQLRPIGRGGAVPGYEPKLAHVEELRAAYFIANKLPAKTYLEDIEAVPLDHINTALQQEGAQWRVRIVDDDEYEFYLP